MSVSHAATWAASVSVFGTLSRRGLLRPSTPPEWSLFAAKPLVSHISVFLALLRGDQSRMHVNSTLNDARPPCLTCLPVLVFVRGLLLRELHCGADFLMNASKLLHLNSARGFAGLSHHTPSQARHRLEVCTLMCWTLRFCDISWNIHTTLAAWSHWVALATQYADSAIHSRASNSRSTSRHTPRCLLPHTT